MSAAGTSGLRRLGGGVRRFGPRAAGAIAGQVTQALASVVLQVLAARLLGVDGLGLFSILYGTILVGTAIATGMVGDTLTVLDRHRPDLRVALVRWSATVAVLAGVLAAGAAALSGQVDGRTSLLFGAAACVFIVEDAMRRLLMAVQRFWSLAVVDLSSLVTSVVLLVGLHLAEVRLDIGSFMLALLAGQTVAWWVAWARLPRHERHLPLRGAAALREVFSFGAWRSVQLSVRPTTVLVFRLVVTAVAGLASYGHVEAARIYTAPALIAIGGMGSFLMPMYARRPDSSTRALVRRADTVAAALFALVLAFGVAALVLLPWLGPVITDGDFDIDRAAVGSWLVFAVATAALTPYTTLGAVRGRQSVLTLIRFLDPAVALVLLVPVLLVGVEVAPLALAGGSVVAGTVVRSLLVRGRAGTADADRTDGPGGPSGPDDPDGPVT